MDAIVDDNDDDDEASTDDLDTLIKKISLNVNFEQVCLAGNDDNLSNK